MQGETAGPWQIVVDPLGYPSIHATDEDGKPGDLVAHTFADHEHLIAAAPDLYEMLNDVLGEYEFGEGITLATIERGNALLAKARGETRDV